MYKIIICLLTGIIFIWFSYGDCIYNKEWFWECSQTKNITINQDIDKTIAPEETNINLANMDFTDPKECSTDFCFKESQITITVKKTWKPMTSVINDSWLLSWDFAKNFPNISEKKLLNNGSPVYDRLILQKVLYERWILDSKPTGKIGYLTEQAIMKLQCVKWFKEYNTANGTFIIWPKTIEETNKIKEKMKDPKYLKKTMFPNVDFTKCWKDFQTRDKELDNLAWNPPSRANNNYLNNINPDYSITPEGEVKIKKEIISN